MPSAPVAREHSQSEDVVPSQYDAVGEVEPYDPRGRYGPDVGILRAREEHALPGIEVVVFALPDTDVQRSLEQENDVVGLVFHAEQVGVFWQSGRSESGRIDAAVVTADGTVYGTAPRKSMAVFSKGQSVVFHHFVHWFFSLFYRISVVYKKVFNRIRGLQIRLNTCCRKKYAHPVVSQSVTYTVRKAPFS